LGQINAIVVALELAQLVLVAHLDGVEIANVNANLAENAPAKIYFKVVDNLAPPAGVIGEFWVVLHLSSHTLSGTIPNADHATRAVRLVNILIPQERGKTHVPFGNRQAFFRVWILGCDRFAERRFQRHHKPF
jgi:hypothetical protein